MKNVLENRLISLQNLQQFKNLLIQKLQNGDIPLPGGAPATTTTPGIVKPDGTSITVDSDGTIHSQGGSGGTNADWDALPGEPGYIQNKPFDTGGEIALANNLKLDKFSDMETFYVYTTSFSDMWFTEGDIGETVSIYYNEEKYSGIVEAETIGSGVMVKINCSELMQPVSFPAFLIICSASSTTIGVMVEEDLGNQITISEITKGEGEPSKLDGSKIKIDNTTIQVNENGELYSQGGGASSWNDLTDKPFESIGSGLTVSSNQLKQSYAGASAIGGIRIVWNSSDQSLRIYTQD